MDENDISLSNGFLLDKLARRNKASLTWHYGNIHKDAKGSKGTRNTGFGKRPAM